MTDCLIILGFAFFGMAVGSFLNVCIDRLPAGESIIRLPSHCESCKRRIRWRDLVPVFSYMWLRGRCRHCGERIPLRLPLVELATGVIFGLLAWHYGLNPQLIMALVYVCLFLLIFVIDLEQQMVLYAVVLPAIALAFIFSFFWGGFGDYWPQSGIANTYLDGLACAFFGGAVGFVFMIVPYIIARMHYGEEGMGQGDIYLAVLIGMATGFPLVIMALIMGIIAGGIAAVALIALKIRKRKDPIAFGPFLAAAAMLILVWGAPIMEWYSGLVY